MLKSFFTSEKYKVFVNSLEKFMEKNNLFSDSKVGYVAVSGGVDSIAMLAVMLGLKEKGRFDELFVVHINHGIRVESDEEERFITDLCEKLQVPLISEKLNLSQLNDNIEHVARNKRYEIFNSIVPKDDYIYTAHHLDDSFEWYLLQLLKTSSVTEGLSIPIKNGNVIRPLIKTSKEDILMIQEELALPFVQDESNKDNRFERNFIRNKIIPLIKERFPGHLGHYQSRINSMNSLIKVNKENKKFIKYKYGDFLTCYNSDLSRDFSDYRENIISVIKELSNSERGALAREVDKLLQAILNYKKGPMIFSGGVSCIIDGPILHFYQSKLLIVPSFTGLKCSTITLDNLEINEKLNAISLELQRLGSPVPLVFISSKKNMMPNNLGPFAQFESVKHLINHAAQDQLTPMTMGHYVKYEKKFDGSQIYLVYSL